VAWREFAFSQLRQGHLVLWNPHYLCGAPFLGGFESALFYPPNWLYLFLPMTFAINFGIVLHVFLAGLFTYLWSQNRGLQPLACLVAGTVFMFGGAYYLHLYAGHLPNLCTMAWAPLIFLSIDGLLKKIKLGWILLGVFAVSMQILAGHPQYLYFTAIIVGLYTLLHLAGHRAPWKTLGAILFLYAGSSLVTAIQLWTGLQALLECGRNIPFEYKSASSFSFPPENLLTLFMPNFFGNLDAGHYWGRWFLWEVSLFIGATSVFLVLLAVQPQGAKNERKIFFLAAITFLFALGSYTPLFNFFYDFMPGFNGLRGICKFNFLTSLFLGLLTGMGLDRLAHRTKTDRRIAFFTGSTGLLLVGVGLWVKSSAAYGTSGSWGEWQSQLHWLKSASAGMTPSDLGQFLRDSGSHSAYSLFLAGATFSLLAVLLVLRPRYPKVVYVIGALAVMELFLFARSNRPTFELAKLQNKFDQYKAIYDKDPGDYRVYGTASASLVTGGYDLWEDEPMVLGRYGRFVCASQGLEENQLFSVLPIYKKFTPLFGLLRLKYLVSNEDGRVEVQPTRFNLAPRMFLIQNYQVAQDSRQALGLLFEPGFDPSRNAILEEEPHPQPTAGPVEGSVSWKDLSTDAVEVTAWTSKPSVLLITDNFSSGWKAEAYSDSGQQTYRVLPADGFLRAIPVKAGQHHFRMEYKPSAFEIGRWVSILACLLYVAITKVIHEDR